MDSLKVFELNAGLKRLKSNILEKTDNVKSWYLAQVGEK